MPILTGVALRRTASAALLLTLALAGSAAAAVPERPTVLDGPSADVLGVDGVAMSRDGSGGLVYRKREDGKVHVYVSRLVGGAWQTPQRVDVGQAYNSSAPAIGAGDGGRLVVTWIHEFGGGVQDRMYSAVLGPGATRFQDPIALDLDVRDGQDAAPALSMTPGGIAYLAYRVVYSRADPNLPPGTVDADIRVARFGGSYWSLLGAPADRNPAQPMRRPTATNGPQIATDASGNAVVAWSEPDDDLIDRVYARRLFGATPGLVLQVSPATDPADPAKPLRSGPDQFSLDVSPFGAAAVAYRQQPASGASFTRARAMVNLLPASFSEASGAFTGARTIDGGGADGPEGLGPVSVGVDDTVGFTTGLGSGSAVLDAAGSVKALDPLARLDDGSSSGTPDVVLDRGAQGEVPAAWKLDQGGATGVELFLRRVDGSSEASPVATDTGGPVTDLRLAGSGLGDAAVAFAQGDEDARSVAAAVIDAPPEPFGLAVPLDWVKETAVPLTWDKAPAGVGAVSYTVAVDGQGVAGGLTGTRYTLDAAKLPDGEHPVQVFATDPAGQSTQTREATVMIDRVAPAATVRAASRRRVRITVTDAASGLTGGTVRWGDGKRGTARKTLSHRYKKAGRYRVVLTVRDEAGNARTVRKAVKVR